MIYAYDKLYVENARETLGNMLHFAVHDLGRDLTSFYDAFIVSGLAKRFGKGEPKLTVGMSGAELACEVVRCSSGNIIDVKPKPELKKTPEYWTGWAVAYYEWDKDISFERINEIVPIDQIKEMYNPLHEADIAKFVDIMDKKIEEYKAVTRLARLRAYAGMTQRILAEKSGVSVRMIEQYEQGKKDINKASVDTVYKLSKALGCDMESIIG